MSLSLSDQYSATIQSINALTSLPQPLSTANQSSLQSLSAAAQSLASAIASDAANSPVLAELAIMQGTLAGTQAQATEATTILTSMGADIHAMRNSINKGGA